MLNYANYAQQCYSANSSSGMFDCTSFVRPGSMDFQNGLSRSDDANIRLDTGYIDSNNELGMNAPEDERVLLGAVLSCAPLSTEGCTTDIITETEDFPLYV